MSLLLLFGGGCPPEDADSSGSALSGFLGNLKAVLDAIHKEDDRIGGQAVTRLSSPLLASEEGCMLVDSTIGFGEDTDGLENARLLVGGEIITASTRNKNTPFAFGVLRRAQQATAAVTHPAGTLVFDQSRNTSALDLLRRGFLVNFAQGEDLDTIARNLGLERCPGVGQEALRRVIKAVAYLPKQTMHAFEETLTALLGSSTAFTVFERTTTSPWTVFAEIDTDLATDVRGRFLLNGGEPQLLTAPSTVVTAYPIQHVLGVYEDTPLTRRGFRDGITNLATTNTFVGQTITLDTPATPNVGGTPVIVDYGAFDAHFLALDETVRQDFLNQDHWAYLADPLLSARCLLDQIRAAGVRVELSTRL
jgi:hypothetical protein